MVVRRVVGCVLVAGLLACQGSRQEAVKEETESVEAIGGDTAVAVNTENRQEESAGNTPESYWWYEDVIKEYLKLFCKRQKQALTQQEEHSLEILKGRIDSLNESISDPQERVAFTRALNWLASPQSCEDVEL